MRPDKLDGVPDFVASFPEHGSGTPVPANEFPRGFVPNFAVSSGNDHSVQHSDRRTARARNERQFRSRCSRFIDELAIAADKDPLQFRLDVLNSPVAAAAAGGRGGGFNAARAIGVVERVREMSNWNTRRKLLCREARAWAWPSSLRTPVMSPMSSKPRSMPTSKIKINKAWAAVDIGRQIVNTSMAKNLVEGGFIEGMSHVMGWEITIDKGRVVQNNFSEFQPDAHAASCAESIEVNFVLSDNNPTGLGEPSLPPAVPAITNAIFHATGVRIRTLPLEERLQLGT